MSARLLLRLACAALAAPIALAARDAWALQPLDTFVSAARAKNPDAREAVATEAQRDAEVDVARGRYLPSFTAQGVYTRNQYEASIAAGTFGAGSPAIVIIPQNQLDAYLTLAVPVVDVGAWDRKSAAEATREATHATRVSTELTVENEVDRGYYQLLGDESFLVSAHKNEDVAEANLRTVRDRREIGTASELDVQRAISDVASAKEAVASADQSVANARRNLETLSGVTPDPVTAFPDDDLHDEGPLSQWTGRASDDLVAVKTAKLATVAAEKNRDAARATWLPTVSAQAQERVTNASGFTGHTALYTLSAALTWKADFTIAPTVRAQNAALAAAEAREEKVRRAADDAIFTAWTQVRASIEKSRAARAQVAATALALSLANDRYTSGVATQLDVVQAQRDAFGAEVARIQADADLSYARAALRIAVRRMSDKESR